MAEYKFRTIPEAERDPENVRARQLFEEYGVDVQSMKIKASIGAVTGALAGGSKAGIPGAVIGAAIGALTSYWKSKAYRNQVYAQLDAMGLLRRPRVRYRGATALRNAKFVFVRLPFAEQTALIIVPLLQKYYPNMTDAQLTNAGQNSQRALILFRQSYPDVPLALAAEAVLAYYGITRNAAGQYDLFAKPSPGQSYLQPPRPVITPSADEVPEVPDLPPPITPPPEGERKRPWMIYLVIGGIVLLMLSD